MARAMHSPCPLLSARLDEGSEVGFPVLVAARIGDQHRRSQQDLAAGGERAPVVVAKLGVVAMARRAKAQRAAIVDDLPAIHPGLEEALAALAVAKAENEIGPAPERDRRLGVFARHHVARR